MSTPISAEVRRDLAPKGKLRAAINYGNAVLVQRNAQTGAMTGITLDLANEIGKRLGVEVEFIPFDGAGKVSDSAGDDVWDIAFMAIDPARAKGVIFTAAYVIIEGSYLVRNESPIRTIADADQSGVRIAVGKGAAYDLFLSRTLKNAQLERAGNSALAIDMFVEKNLEAAAGVKQPLITYASEHPGFRVIDGRFTAIEQAMGLPLGRNAGAEYISAFIEEMKASGFVADALKRHNQPDAAVAPLAKK